MNSDCFEYIAKYVRSMKIDDSPWDDGERVVTLNGMPIGGTATHPEADRWGQSLLDSIADAVEHEGKRLKEECCEH